MSITKPRATNTQIPHTQGVLDQDAAEALAERLADVFRTAHAVDILTDDVFLDGHPPEWRFQLQGLDAFNAWIRGYSPSGADTTVARTVPTATGFVMEILGSHVEDGDLITDRKIILCETRGDQVSDMTVYCSGDWDSELRTRHAAETTLIRP